MKKVIGLISLICVLFLTSCKSNANVENIYEYVVEKQSKITSYEAKETMEVIHEDKSVIFDVEVLYKEPSFYRVTLTNKENNSVQVILKNQDGVYVLNPGLNKQFKFDSTWPINSSHSYLYQSIINDLVADEGLVISEENGDFLFTSTFNHKTNKDLTTQKVLIDSQSFLPKEVIIVDAENKTKIKVTFVSFKENISIKDECFDVEKVMNSSVANLGEGTLNRVFEVAMPTVSFEETSVEVTNLSDNQVMLVYSGARNYTILETLLDTSEVSFVERYYDDFVIGNKTILISRNSVTAIDENFMVTVFSNDLTFEEQIEILNSID